MREVPRFTDEQLLAELRQAKAGTTDPDTCRKMGVTETTFISRIGGVQGRSASWGCVYASSRVRRGRGVKLQRFAKLRKRAQESHIARGMVVPPHQRLALSMSTVLDTPPTTWGAPPGPSEQADCSTCRKTRQCSQLEQTIPATKRMRRSLTPQAITRVRSPQSMRSRL